MKGTGRHLGCALLAAAMLACGGGGDSGVARTRGGMDSTPVGGSGRDPNPPVASTRAPSIVSLTLSPDPLLSGGVVRAVVRMAKGRDSYDLEYVWEVAGHTIQDAGGSITLPETRKGDAVRVTVVARNDAGRSAPASAQASIPNTAPIIVDLRIGEKTGADGEVEAWAASVSARDADDDFVEYEYQWLVNGWPSNIRGAYFPLASLSRGDQVRLRVVASDGEDVSPPAESGTLEIANRAPEIVSSPPRLDPSGVYRYTIEAEDPDGDRSLRFELVSGPRGMQVDDLSGVLSWTPATDQAGRHEVEIAVDDRHGGRASQVFVIPVVARETWNTTPAAIGQIE